MDIRHELRVGVGIRFSKLHQLTSGFMNPLTDMRKNKSPPKKNCIHVDTFINDLWKGRKIRLKTIIPIISWTTRLQQYTQIAYSSGFINAELWKDNPLKVCILYFLSIRIIPYENKKIHNDRVEDILCFRLCQIPTKYGTLHSNYFKLHNFVRLLLFFCKYVWKLNFITKPQYFMLYL